MDYNRDLSKRSLSCQKQQRDITLERSPLNDRMRARTYYAASVSLFQDPSADDCERAIEPLNKAVDLNSDFSEASLLREEVWYYRLKSFGWGHNNRTYKRYLNSVPSGNHETKTVPDPI